MAQGDPIDEFIALPREQQLSTLQALSPEKQDKLLTQVKQRRATSARAVTAPAPRAGFHPLDALAESAQKNFRHLAPEDMAEEEKSGFGTGHPAVDRFLANTATSAIKDAAAMPAAAVDWVVKSPWTPRQSVERMQENAQGATPAPKTAPKVTGADVSDYASQALGGLTAGALAGEVGAGALKLAPRVVRGAAEAVSGTGTGPVKGLVKDARAANAARDAFSDTQAAVETARQRALRTGNEKYNTVNEKLNPIPADMETVHGLYHEAAESFGEPQAQPALINRLGKALQNNTELTYKDEQALYSELGKELSKGTLPGPMYHAYDVLHEGIGKDMQRIADSKGQGPQLTEARNYWRRMKQTFGKPHTATDAASRTLAGTSPEIAEANERANRIRLLGSFDPEIPGKFSRLDAATNAAKKKLAPEKIGAGEVQEAKTKSLAKRADLVQHKALWIAAGPPIYALVDLIKGHGVNLGEVASVSGGVGALSVAASRLMENPKFVEFMTKATPRDVAAIPPELRGDFPAIVKAAQSKGIRISPALAGMATAGLAPRRRYTHTAVNAQGHRIGSNDGTAWFDATTGEPHGQ